VNNEPNHVAAKSLGVCIRRLCREEGWSGDLWIEDTAKRLLKYSKRAESTKRSKGGKTIAKH
jgi:hypothetical protein